MNYFRYLLLAALVLAFTGMPLTAMEPRAPRSSLFGRYYNYASSWVSSSFLVTREFVKREFTQIKDRLAFFNRDLQTANTKAAEVERALETVRKDQHLYRDAFKSITDSHTVRLDNHKKEIEAHKQKQDDMAERVRAARIAAEEADITVGNARVDMELAKDSVAQQRKAIEAQNSQLTVELQKQIQSVNVHYENQNSQLNKALAALEANRREMTQLNSDIGSALVDARKRIEAQKKASEQLKELQKQTEDQNQKVKALALAFSGFKTTFFAARLPKSSYVPFAFPGASYSQSHASSNGSSDSNKVEMEEID